MRPAAEIWQEDLERSSYIYHLNHFYFCYIHPEDVTILLLGIRMEAALDARSNLATFICPMLQRTWKGPIYDLATTDFRPDIRHEILTNTGIKPHSDLECYKLCPDRLRLSHLDFFTMQQNCMEDDISDNWWFPSIDYSWVRDLRAATSKPAKRKATK